MKLYNMLQSSRMATRRLPATPIGLYRENAIGLYRDVWIAAIAYDPERG